MSALKKLDNWQTKIFLWIGLPLITAMGVVFGAFDLVPAWQAKGGGGTPGTFTAVREDCGRRSCTWYGDWVAADGSSKRSDVILYDEPDATRVGTKVEALDSGARNGVFAAAGGSSYLIVSGIVLAGLASAVAFFFVVRHTIRKRRQLKQAEPVLDFS